MTFWPIIDVDENGGSPVEPTSALASIVVDP